MLSLRRLALRLAPVVLGSATLVACGSDDPDTLLTKGQDAYAAGDYSEALSAFESVLGNAEAADGTKFKAARDAVAAQGRVNGEAAAQKAFADLEKTYKDRLDVDILAKIASDLADAELTEIMLEVFEVANMRLEGLDEAQQKSKRKQLESLSAKLAAAGGEGAAAKLAALGYLSGGDDEEDDEE